MGTPMTVHPSRVTHANVLEASCESCSLLTINGGSSSDGLGFRGINLNVLNLGSIRET